VVGLVDEPTPGELNKSKNSSSSRLLLGFPLLVKVFNPCDVEVGAIEFEIVAGLLKLFKKSSKSSSIFFFVVFLSMNESIQKNTTNLKNQHNDDDDDDVHSVV
jgi:hypothetical protein